MPNKVFTGKVSFISPYGAPDTNGVVRFNVTILLDPTDVPLKGLLTSTAEIAVSSVQNALVLPLAAVTTSKDGSFVTVMTSDNRTEKRSVTLGLQNQQIAAVVTGLKEGERVVIQESAAGAPTTTRPPGMTGGPPSGGGGGPPPGR